MSEEGMRYTIARRQRCCRTLHIIRENRRGKTLCKKVDANMCTEMSSKSSKVCAECYAVMTGRAKP